MIDKMQGMDYLALGKRIREIRERKGKSLTEVAEKSGLSAEKLKRIEADKEQPLIGNLISLSKALNVNVAEIFRDRPLKGKFEITRKEDRERVRPLISPGKAKIFDYQYELLTQPSEEKHLDAYLIELPPHQSKPPRQDVTHDGEEFVYLLEGVMEGEIAGEPFRLLPGDSLYLRSTLPHIFFNPGKTVARALTVIYPF